MLKQKSYFDSIENFIEHIKTEGLDSEIVAIYLAGSMGRGDFTPGRSDIDLYIVSKDDDKELESKLMAKATEIADENLVELKKVCDNPFTVAFTTIESIEKGSSWLGVGSEYYSFVETARLLLGDDIKDKLPIPIRYQIKEISKQALQMLNQAITEMPEPILNDDNKDYLVKGVFETSFSAIHFLLSYSGVYIRGKKEMVDSFQKLCTDESLNKKCADILSLWKVFETRSLENIEINVLISDVKVILSKTIIN